MYAQVHGPGHPGPLGGPHPPKRRAQKKVVPSPFFCPLSHELMQDPVILVESGQTYERGRIESWLAVNKTDPLTGKKLTKKQLTPNLALKNSISEFKKTHRVTNSLVGPVGKGLAHSDLSNVVLKNYQRNMIKSTFKVSVIGAPSAGKTSLIRQCIYEQFDIDTQSTVGVDIETVAVKLGGRIVKLDFWDTAGQEIYGRLTNTHVRGSNAVLIVYDLTRPGETLQAAEHILDTVQIDDALVFLIGNKADLLEENEGQDSKIGRRMGQKFADKHSMLFFETSAKTAKNVKRLVISLTRSLLALHRSLHSRQVSSSSSQLLHRNTVEINALNRQQGAQGSWTAQDCCGSVFG